jgi:hypothetical protein
MARKRNRYTLQEACNLYVQRFTMEHVPAWTQRQRADGTYYAPQFRTDAEWYANTKFHGDKGHPGRWFTGCYTTGQTWPLGESLPAPYRRAAAA